MTEDGYTELARRVRYWLGQGENALDMAAAAMMRAGQLDADYRAEFESDLGVLRDKLDRLHEMINSLTRL